MRASGKSAFPWRKRWFGRSRSTRRAVNIALNSSSPSSFPRRNAANKQANDELLQTAMEYKQHWEGVLERRERLGITGPEPLPHPDESSSN